MSNRAVSFFKEASKLVPVITALAGAAVSGATAWVAVKDELVDLRRRNEQMEAKFESHIIGYDHDIWFGDDWIRHPALRGCLERWLLREQREQDTAVRQYHSEECKREWQRFLELNPSLVKPGGN